MTERRRLRCLHWRSGEDHPDAIEREFQVRFGPEVALVGDCRHPDHRRSVNSRWCCEHWEDAVASPDNLPEDPPT